MGIEKRKVRDAMPVHNLPCPCNIMIVVNVFVLPVLCWLIAKQTVDLRLSSAAHLPLSVVDYIANACWVDS